MPLGPGAAMLLVREVYSDWAASSAAPSRIHRADRAGARPAGAGRAADGEALRVAGKILLSRLRTFLAFPEWFYLKLPVNTMTAPRPTPGGLATQFSSVGHYDLADDQAMIVTVPAAGRGRAVPGHPARQHVVRLAGLHQPPDQPHRRPGPHDPDGLMRFVISEHDPGVANWLECTGHRRGYVQIRWQRLARPLTAEDGPRVEVVPSATCAAGCRTTSRRGSRPSSTRGGSRRARRPWPADAGLR